MSGRGDGKLRPAYIRRGERYWTHQDQKKTSIDEKIEYLRWKGMTDDEIQRVQANVQARYPDTVLENTPLPETGRRKKRSKSGLQRKATNKNPRTRTVLVQQQTEDAAATKIQSIQRGRRSRNEVRMRKKEREEAATKIQAIQRGKRTRDEARKERERAVKRGQEAEARRRRERDAAATKIQAAQRRKHARAEYSKRKVATEAKRKEAEALHRHRVNELFDKFDRDGNQSITHVEFRAMIAAMGKLRNDMDMPGAEEAKLVLGALDSDGNGELSKPEFLTWVLDMIGRPVGERIQFARETAYNKRVTNFFDAVHGWLQAPRPLGNTYREIRNIKRADYNQARMSSANQTMHTAYDNRSGRARRQAQHTSASTLKRKQQAKELRARQLKNLRRLFDRFDTDNDGILSRDDFSGILSSFQGMYESLNEELKYTVTFREGPMGLGIDPKEGEEVGSVVTVIVKNSQADHKEIYEGDHVLAIGDRDITHLNHEETHTTILEQKRPVQITFSRQPNQTDMRFMLLKLAPKGSGEFFNYLEFESFFLKHNTRSLQAQQSMANHGIASRELRKLMDAITDWASQESPVEAPLVESKRRPTPPHRRKSRPSQRMGRAVTKQEVAARDKRIRDFARGKEAKYTAIRAAKVVEMEENEEYEIRRMDEKRAEIQHIQKQNKVRAKRFKQDADLRRAKQASAQAINESIARNTDVPLETPPEPDISKLSANDASMVNDQTYCVKFKRGPLGMGIDPKRSSAGSYVSSVVPGGQADASMQIQEGDTLISVGKENITQISHENVVQMLRKAKRPLVITFQRVSTEERRAEYQAKALAKRSSANPSPSAPLNQRAPQPIKNTTPLQAEVAAPLAPSLLDESDRIMITHAKNKGKLHTESAYGSHHSTVEEGWYYNPRQRDPFARRQYISVEERHYATTPLIGTIPSVPKRMYSQEANTFQSARAQSTPAMQETSLPRLQEAVSPSEAVVPLPEPHPSEQTPSVPLERFDVSFPSGPMGFGVETPLEGKDEGSVVVSVKPNSVAELLGVEVGDILAAVGDKDISHLNHHDATEVIRNAPRPVVLHFQRGAASCRGETNTSNKTARPLASMRTHEKGFSNRQGTSNIQLESLKAELEMQLSARDQNAKHLEEKFTMRANQLKREFQRELEMKERLLLQRQEFESSTSRFNDQANVARELEIATLRLQRDFDQRFSLLQETLRKDRADPSDQRLAYIEGKLNAATELSHQRSSEATMPSLESVENRLLSQFERQFDSMKMIIHAEQTADKRVNEFENRLTKAEEHARNIMAEKEQLMADKQKVELELMQERFRVEQEKWRQTQMESKNATQDALRDMRDAMAAELRKANEAYKTALVEMRERETAMKSKYETIVKEQEELKKTVQNYRSWVCISCQGINSARSMHCEICGKENSALSIKPFIRAEKVPVSPLKRRLTRESPTHSHINRQTDFEKWLESDSLDEYTPTYAPQRPLRKDKKDIMSDGSGIDTPPSNFSGILQYRNGKPVKAIGGSTRAI